MLEKIIRIKNEIIKFFKTHLVVLGALIATLGCIIFYLYVLNFGKDTSQNFNANVNVVLMKDTTCNGIKTAYIYDIIQYTGIIVNPVKYKDVYTFNRITSQLKIVKQRADTHHRVINYFIVNLYYFVVIQIIFGIIATILGLVISKKGWGDSSDNLLATFLVIVGFLLFFQIIPKGMKLEDNLSTNKAHYIAYCDIENRILTYLSDSVVVERVTKKIDKLLKANHAISFDLQQIPFSEIQNSFEEITNVAEDKGKDDKPVLNQIPRVNKPKIDKPMVDKPITDNSIIDTLKNSEFKSEGTLRKEDEEFLKKRPKNMNENK